MSEELADHAINRVLAAEEEARGAIARCNGQAAAIRREASERVRRIVERVEQRIATVHELGEGALRRELAAMQSRERAYSGTPDVDEELARLDRVIDTLVREMLGEGP